MRRARQPAKSVWAALSVLQLGQVTPSWRTPTATEIGQDWRAESPHRFADVSADFDGDGRVDRARLMVATTGRQAALVVELAASPANAAVLDTLESVDWLGVMGIDVVQPGKYRTACGKGYTACGHDEPEELVLLRPAIEYFKEGSASSFFFYDRSSKRFRRVWISD